MSPSHEGESDRNMGSRVASFHSQDYPSRLGSLIPPNTEFAKRIHNDRESDVEPFSATAELQSNLTKMLNEHAKLQKSTSTEEAFRNRVPEPPETLDEADSASGPRLKGANQLCSSVPLGDESRGRLPSTGHLTNARTSSTTTVPARRYLSIMDLTSLAPASGSPYQCLLEKKNMLEVKTRERLKSLRSSNQLSSDYPQDDNSSSSSKRHAGSNQLRHRRRAKHNEAVVTDLCEVVADLFLAESKLLKPLQYGVSEETYQTSQQSQKQKVIQHVRKFVSALPTRYALSADTPSEVLLHMRLMAAARADNKKAAVHIHNLEEDEQWKNHVRPGRFLRLVTITCSDTIGILELITKNLATGGSRVLDADVMISSDGIVLDRFVVDMSGRLLLDKLANLIEAFLLESNDSVAQPLSLDSSNALSVALQGSLYHYTTEREIDNDVKIHKEIESAIPLREVLASADEAPKFTRLRRLNSMPARPVGNTLGTSPDGATIQTSSTGCPESPSIRMVLPPEKQRDRRVLVNRSGVSNLDNFGFDEHPAPLDFVTVENDTNNDREIPVIPFEDIMLIDTVASGRASTIYRAAWQRPHPHDAVASHTETTSTQSPTMIALKVAIVDRTTGDYTNVDEVRQEADIAARLRHSNICDLVGVAIDPDCFCLAYEFCEGGSLLSLLNDSSRFYEYLPIALDIANGMAYLHSRSILHRDLKPSNVLLTRDHRAKIADFGMSVTNTGQELTAETGTYRYMAPEVIRHESYSSNADVYSFGICLWQLITREVPFASMTPIQAAYAVAQGQRPEIPPSTPRRLQEILTACWDQDSSRRPSFTYIAMALADYARTAFSPANVGTSTLHIANEIMSNVEGNSTVNVDFTAPTVPTSSFLGLSLGSNHDGDDIGLAI